MLRLIAQDRRWDTVFLALSGVFRIQNRRPQAIEGVLPRVADNFGHGLNDDLTQIIWTTISRVTSQITRSTGSRWRLD